MDAFELYYYLIAAIIGFLIHWGLSAEGSWWFQTKILKKPAKILTTIHAGKLLSQEVVVPKMNYRTKKEETIIPDWFNKESPIYRKIGSGAHYIFRFKEEVGLLDFEKIERGVYKHNEESMALYNRAISEKKKADAAYKDYLAAVENKDLAKAQEYQKTVEEYNDSANGFLQASQEARSFLRMSPLPPEWLTTQIRSIQHHTVSSILGSFLAKLMSKWNIILLIIGMAALFSFIATVMLAYGLFFKGGIHF